MAAIAAAAAAFSTLNLSRTSVFLPRCHLRRAITSSLSSATTELGAKFAAPKPKPKAHKPAPREDSEQFIPWTVNDESGDVTLKTTSSERFLRAVVNESTQRKKKKEDRGSGGKDKPGVPTAEPKYSKAARRFYNERFREPPQRLAKVLAAAGGKCLNSVCNLMKLVGD